MLEMAVRDLAVKTRGKEPSKIIMSDRSRSPPTPTQQPQPIIAV
jgi:hypothetical protein